MVGTGALVAGEPEVATFAFGFSKAAEVGSAGAKWLHIAAGGEKFTVAEVVVGSLIAGKTSVLRAAGVSHEGVIRFEAAFQAAVSSWKASLRGW
jgi:hypothetical protein